MAKVSKILKFKSKNGEPVPIYIKTIDGINIYKTPFQLPDELGKYIQNFIRPKQSQRTKGMTRIQIVKEIVADWTKAYSSERSEFVIQKKKTPTGYIFKIIVNEIDGDKKTWNSSWYQSVTLRQMYNWNGTFNNMNLVEV